MNELIENDFSSILTQITPVLSRQPSLEPICITFLKDTESEINFSNFLNEQEVKFKIENYYKIVENCELTGFEKYKRDCHKYNLAPIESFKNCFLEEIELDLNVSTFRVGRTDHTHTGDERQANKLIKCGVWLRVQ